MTIDSPLVSGPSKQAVEASRGCRRICEAARGGSGWLVIMWLIPWAFSAGVRAQTWEIETVHEGRDFVWMSDRSLALDSLARPHVAYGYENLYYAWFDGRRWHSDSVDESPGGGWGASLALDSLGFAHISYGGGGLKYAHQEAEGWDFDLVDEAGGGTRTSVALDENGYPHIGYIAKIGSDYTTNDLYYAYMDAAGWHVQPVDTTGYAGSPSLALDATGRPHIAYVGEGGLGYAHVDDSGWVVEGIVAQACPGVVSLALDSLGRPHIACDGGISDFHITYAHWGATGWVIEEVAGPNYWTYASLSLGLDDLEYPHISYYNEPGGYAHSYQLRHMYRDAAGWHDEEVDPGDGEGLFNSVALDAAGRVHVTYCGQVGERDVMDLRYAKKEADGWHVQVIDWRGGVGGSTGRTSVALCADGAPSISHDFCGVMFSRKTGTAWHHEVVDHDGGHFRGMSMKLDSRGVPHIGYLTAWYSQTRLRYAYRDSSGWHKESVDTHVPPYSPPALALDSSGHPHLAYVDDAYSGELTYASRTAGAWEFEVVDAVSWPDFEGVSMAFDSFDSPHVAYSVEGELKHAWRDGRGWCIEVVDSPVYTVPSVAVDSRGFAHICYTFRRWWGCVQFEGVKYAYQDADGWHLDMVDLGSNREQGGWLALDSCGRAHICYANSGLKYAYQDGYGWRLQTVDSLGAVGRSSSLALDAIGRPHIVYLDETEARGALKYAYGLDPIGGPFRDSGPSNIQILGAWPNPFSVSTRICWSQGPSSLPCLAVFDMLGRRVATLWDGPPEAGSQQLTWRPAGLPSGAYVVRLSQDDRMLAAIRVVYAP